MRLLILFLSLSKFAARVSASKAAGPLATMWLWYAYRMDGMRDSSNWKFHCTGTGPSRRCKFDEFLRYADKHPWTGTTSVGDSLDPDVDKTVKELEGLRTTEMYKQDQLIYHNTPDAAKLFPNDFGGQTNVKMQDLHSKVMNIVQAARLEVGDERMSTQLGVVRDIWSRIHSARLEENAEPERKLFQKFIKQKLGINFSDVVTPEGKTYQVLDLEKLERENPKIKPKLMEEVRNFPKAYAEGTLVGFGKDGKKGKGHYEAIHASQMFETWIRGPASCR